MRNFIARTAKFHSIGLIAALIITAPGISCYQAAAASYKTGAPVSLSPNTAMGTASGAINGSVNLSPAGMNAPKAGLYNPLVPATPDQIIPNVGADVPADAAQASIAVQEQAGTAISGASIIEAVELGARSRSKAAGRSWEEGNAGANHPARRSLLGATIQALRNIRIRPNADADTLERIYDNAGPSAPASLSPVRSAGSRKKFSLPLALSSKKIKIAASVGVATILLAAVPPALAGTDRIPQANGLMGLIDLPIRWLLSAGLLLPWLCSACLGMHVYNVMEKNIGSRLSMGMAATVFATPALALAGTDQIPQANGLMGLIDLLIPWLPWIIAVVLGIGWAVHAYRLKEKILDGNYEIKSLRGNLNSKQDIIDGLQWTLHEKEFEAAAKTLPGFQGISSFSYGDNHPPIALIRFSHPRLVEQAIAHGRLSHYDNNRKTYLLSTNGQLSDYRIYPIVGHLSVTDNGAVQDYLVKTFPVARGYEFDWDASRGANATATLFFPTEADRNAAIKMAIASEQFLPLAHEPGFYMPGKDEFPYRVLFRVSPPATDLHANSH